MDRDRGIYADWRKVHPIDFHGEFFKCRGPLNTVPSPQRRPTFVQAGGSPRGRAIEIAAPNSAELAKSPDRELRGVVQLGGGRGERRKFLRRCVLPAIVYGRAAVPRSSLRERPP